MTIDLDSLRGEDAFVGLDLSTVNDLCAAAVYLPRQSVLLARAWCPARRLTERSRMDGVPYELWRNKGFLHTTKSSERAIDKRELVEDFIEWISPFNVIELAYDRWGIAEFKRILADIDIDLPLAEHGQGFKDMSPATKAFQTLVLNQSIKHDGNPILTWCITNVVLSGDAAGNVKPDKRRATERIDVAVAAIMAVGAANKRAPDERLWTPETRIV
jgi:phage terminase large subunit-like protein